MSCQQMTCFAPREQMEPTIDYPPLSRTASKLEMQFFKEYKPIASKAEKALHDALVTQMAQCTKKKTTLDTNQMVTYRHNLFGPQVDLPRDLP